MATVKEILATLSDEEKELLNYSEESVKEYGCVVPRTPMDNAIYYSMTKNQRLAFNYVLGCVAMEKKNVHSNPSRRLK